MRPLDTAVIALYFALTLGIGFWAARRPAHPTGTNAADDYFLGARDLPAWAVMLSIVATETSALTVLSVPGIGARGDFTFVQLALGYLVGRIGVAVWLLPGYFDGRQQTAYQRLETRFGAATRRWLSVVFLVTRFLADGVRMFAGAIPLALLTGWDVGWAIVAMGGVTLLYTFFGGLKAVVWADALQLAVYLVGGAAALWMAVDLAGGAQATWQMADQAGKLRLFDFSWSLSQPFVFVAALLGGAMLSAASHGADHIIVQRLLATRSLRDAQRALVGSGLLVILQFALFVAVGTALWAAGQAPAELKGDQIFARFILDKMPAGMTGLLVAAILAAAMSTISSSISALASSMTNDLYASLSGRRDPAHLLAVGRAFSLVWGLLLIAGALGFHVLGRGQDTPVVVLALSVASITYGALLGALVLAAWQGPWRGQDVVAAAGLAIGAMGLLVMAGRLQAAWPALAPALAPLGRLAWPWYVPLGTLCTVAVAVLLALRRPPAPRLPRDALGSQRRLPSHEASRTTGVADPLNRT